MNLKLVLKVNVLSYTPPVYLQPQSITPLLSSIVVKLQLVFYLFLFSSRVCFNLETMCSFHKKIQVDQTPIKTNVFWSTFSVCQLLRKRESKKKILHLFHLCSFSTSLNWLRFFFFFECRHIVSGYEWDALMGEFVASESRRSVN